MCRFHLARNYLHATLLTFTFVLYESTQNLGEGLCVYIFGQNTKIRNYGQRGAKNFKPTTSAARRAFVFFR